MHVAGAMCVKGMRAEARDVYVSSAVLELLAGQGQGVLEL
jgi:hypothetical protein